MDAANDIQKTRYQSMCCTKWWILRWNNFLFLTRYPYNAQFIEKYPHLDFSSFFRNEVRMFLHFLPQWRGTWNPVNHLPSLLHSPPTHPPPLPLYARTKLSQSCVINFCRLWVFCLSFRECKTAQRSITDRVVKGSSALFYLARLSVRNTAITLKTVT